MKPTVTRALIVLTVFALLGVLNATNQYVGQAAAPPPPSSSDGVPAPPAVEADTAVPATRATGGWPEGRFFTEFRHYLSWALLTPGIWYLARRVPLLGPRRARAVAFHAVVPLAMTVPFFYYRILLNTAFGLRPPPLDVLLHIPLSRIVMLQAIPLVYVYWLLLGLGTLVQLSSEQAAAKLGEIELRRSLSVAQHDALKMKLQPHFLFNALNAVASLARLGETEAVVRVIDHLGRLLRLSMETSAQQLVTLEEELALLDAYLAIEEHRFGERLHVVRRIAPATRRALVPNLILQPIVENALLHGLSRRLDASLLEVTARRDGRHLRIAVRDDGPGLPAGWSLPGSAGAGLSNVSARLQGLFAGDCSFRLQNGETGGAVALLSIPFAEADTTAIAPERPPWSGRQESRARIGEPGRRTHGERLRRSAWRALAGLGACAALAFKDMLAVSLDWSVDPWQSGVTANQFAAWTITFYLLWAGLAPLIFASARRLPVTRRRWAWPLAFHLAASVLVSTAVPTALCLLVFDPLVRGVSWVGQGLPWIRIAVARAVADPLLYWAILGTGFALRAFDEHREREQQAAELRRALVAAQVEALKMKLQPHFLFNTLNSISFLAVEKETTGVVTMVERLGELLRSSMRVTGSQLVTVREELGLADQYLAIEETRFADRLRLSRRIGPGALDALIPALVLQPMIENSIKHGFSRRIDASRLEFAICREGDWLVVTVADDGPGVTPGWDLATHCGRGLKNVIERLEKLYPGSWAYTLENLPGGGAIARLRIPWQVRPAAEGKPLPALGALAPAGS